MSLLLLWNSPVVGHDKNQTREEIPYVRYYPAFEDDDILLLWWALNEYC